MNIGDVQSAVANLIGGENIGETVEGLARYPINVRYPREWRDTPAKLAALPILTPNGSQITLGTVATVKITDGPPMLKSENARPSGWVYVDVRGRDLASTVADLQAAVAAKVKLEPGMSLAYSGQFEFMERANKRLKLVVPATLLIIFVLLYLTFSRFDEAVLIMATLPFALTGGIWFLYAMDYQLSIATGVGFIALAGVSAEFGVIMLLYLKNAWEAKQEAGKTGEADLVDAIREGAVQRVRPKAMTVAVIVAGLLPILLGTRHRQRSHEPHRRAHGRRHAQRAAAVAVCRAGGLPADAPPQAVSARSGAVAGRSGLRQLHRVSPGSGSPQGRLGGILAFCLKR